MGLEFFIIVLLSILFLFFSAIVAKEVDITERQKVENLQNLSSIAEQLNLRARKQTPPHE